MIGYEEARDRGAALTSRGLTSLQQRLVKTSGRLVKHTRYYRLLLAGPGRLMGRGGADRVAAPTRNKPGSRRTSITRGARMEQAWQISIEREAGRGTATLRLRCEIVLDVRTT